MIALACTVLALAAPQGGAEMFAVRTIAVDGASPHTVVAADVRSVACIDALRGLSAAVGWNITIESTPLENDLRFATVDLALADQDPRVVAQLTTVAAGADCVFDDGDAAAGARPTLHVVRRPSAETESGRQRLRALSGQWYRSFLRDELRYEPVVQREGVAVRMHLGELLAANGDVESAIAFFTQAWDKRPHDHVSAAILRIAECHLELAHATPDRARQKAECGKAEEWARRLLDGAPQAPEAMHATILLGRALLGEAAAETQPAAIAAKAERCESELRARAIRLADSVEMLDVWLLSAQAQFLVQRADRVLETMLALRESPWFGDMGERQFLDYHFLLGYGALGSGKPDLAMRSLEWFQIHAGSDPRRGAAHVLLAEAYLAQRRFVQARAASAEARTRWIGSMSNEWRERTLRVWARAALALGEKESAFQELEQLVLRGGEPELSLFLVDEMLADRQWQRAIAVAAPLLETDSPQGDRARFKTVVALFDQAIASSHLDEFPAQAIRLAPKITDPELRGRTATMIGDVYTRLGKVEHAADAYRGILR